MPDSKITALTSISTSTDPANDPLVIVDVSDTSMAATGTTKKVTLNQLLGAFGTATLASATISGDLTAARLIVTGGTIPTNGLWLPTTNTLEFAANSLAQYRIAPLGVFSWFDGAGGTRMTLNATGLGVGAVPDRKLHVGSNVYPQIRLVYTGVNTYDIGVTSGGVLALNHTSTTNGLVLDQNANVGIGVAPSATDSIYYQALEIARVGQGLTCVKTAFTSTPNSWLSNNSYATYSAGTVWKYAVSSQSAVQYRLAGGEHQWFTAPNSGVSGAGTNITFTERLRLKETGQLRFIPLAADPSGAEAGDVYYNSVSNRLKYYNGTAWTLI